MSAGTIGNMAFRIPLAWYNLTHRKRRLVVSSAGIAFAVLLMFAELGFWNGLLDSAVQLIERLNGDLVILSRSKYAIMLREPFARRRLYQAMAVDGVKDAFPLYIEFRYSLWKNPERDEPDSASLRDIRVLAFDPEKPALLIPEVTEYAERLRLPDTVLMDAKSRAFYGKREPGLTRELAQQAVQVIGTFDLGTDFTSNGNVIMSAENYAKLFPDPGDPGATLSQVEIGLVQLQPGADPQTVKAALNNALPEDVTVLTRGEFAQQERTFWQRSTPIGFIFLLGLVIGFIVGVVICYQVLAADVSSRLAEFATLKAIGYHDGYLTALVLKQALLLSLLGFIPGALVSLLLYRLLQNLTGLPMDLTPARAAIVLGLTIGMCFLSGLLAVRKAQTADPAEVF